MTKDQKKSLNSFISQTIRRLRNDINISQEELADRCGLDRTYISSVERGKRNITINSLSKIIISIGQTDINFLQEIINQITISEENKK